MPKNIVICCDGTGNEINDEHSNVLKLYRVLKKNAKQLVYYDPGVGTLSSSSDWGKLKAASAKYAGLMMGYGLDKNVLDAYEFLANNYKKGDNVYLFGFSRGAYTVRALAGFINTIGLLSVHQKHLYVYAFVAYKQISVTNTFEGVRLFNQALNPQRIPIKFLGIWDTVSSMIVPRKDRLYLPSTTQLAYTQKNPSIEVVRHALSIDEKRRMFRPYLWAEGEEYWSGPFKPKNQEEPIMQDVQQVWFAGVHSDVGGGYQEQDSGLSKITLEWMINEAVKFELDVNSVSYNEIVAGNPRKNAAQEYAQPNPTAKAHDELDSKLWKWQEYIPKRVTRREFSKSKGLLGFYLPKEEPRLISEGAKIHDSVKTRMENLSDYKPVNLPASYEVVSTRKTEET